MDTKNIARIGSLATLIFGCSGSPSHLAGRVDEADASPTMAAPTKTEPVQHIVIGDDGGDIATMAADAGAPDGGAPAVAFTLSWSPQDVAPGAEGVNCIDLYTPDDDIYVGGWEVAKKTIHHVNLWIRKPGTTPYTTVRYGCPGGWGQGTFVFDDSDSETLSEDFSSVGAIHFPPHTDVIVDAHYLNSSTTASPQSVTISFQRATKTAPLIYGLAIQGGNSAPPVPPDAVRTTTFTEKPEAKPVRVIALTGHMHAHGVLEMFSINGRVEYRNTMWSEPPVVFPNLVIQPTDKIEWSCTVDNTTAAALPYGQAFVQTAEMCDVFGLALADWERVGTVEEPDAG